MSTSNSLSLAVFVVFLHNSLADVSHLLASEYPAFINDQSPQSFQFFQIPTHYSPHNDIEGIYGPPAIETPIDPTYPKPEPFPVAPTISTTTEFVLPEVVENRKAKDAGHFIPLRNFYLSPPPKPNYKVPKLSYIPPHKEDVPFTSSNNGYNYEKPRTTTTTTTNRPNPIVVADPGDQHNSYNYQVPQIPLFSTPTPVYLPQRSALQNTIVGNSQIQEINPNSEHLTKIHDMRCLRHHGGYFHTVLRLDNLLITELPLVDNDSFDKRCELKQSRGFIVVDIVEADFDLCGVKDCGNDLCLRLRFPIIHGIRTGNDGIVTLHCKSQVRVTAKTYALKMGVTNEVQARSLGAYAHGGTQNAFRTHVELLRKSGNSFTHLLEPSEAVQLGEELLLRAHVLAGDGWNHTKLTDVSLQRVSPSGETLNVVHLINSQGCNNPNTHSICEQAPIYDPPLGHKLAFKAVMFQGMRSGEELVMSMRITGCLEAQDCQLQSSNCGIVGSNLGRRKRNTSLTRSTLNTTKSDEIAHEVSEISSISFRVAFEENQPNFTDIRFKNTLAEAPHAAELNFVLLETLAFVVLLLCLGIFLLLKFK